MKRLITLFFLRYGTAALLIREKKESYIQVFFQPEQSRSQRSAQRFFRPLGQVPRGQYGCFCPGDVQLDVGNTLVLDGQAYRICQVSGMRGAKGVTLYQWCLCMQKGGEDIWG